MLKQQGFNSLLQKCDPLGPKKDKINLLYTAKISINDMWFYEIQALIHPLSLK